MKKSIYELNKKELREVENALMKTEYGNNCVKVVYILIFVSIFITLWNILLAFINGQLLEFLTRGIVPYLILILVSTMIMMINLMSWQKLLKDYYENNYTKKDE